MICIVCGKSVRKFDQMDIIGDDLSDKWKLTTKGESGDEDYFKSTGDFEIILYCYRTHNYPIIVLSDDTEINDIVRLFKTNKLFANVNVYTLDNYDLKQAA